MARGGKWLREQGRSKQTVKQDHSEWSKVVGIRHSDKLSFSPSYELHHRNSLEKFHHVQANLLTNIVIYFILSDMCQAGLLSLLDL